MRILVTGHLGYIGTVLVPTLQARGFDVTGMDSDLYRNSTFGAPPLPVPSIVKDIRDCERRDLEGFDAVIHLAGLSNDPLGDLNPDLTYDINHLGTVRLANLCKQAGVERFLFSSSCSTYGAAGDDILDESAAFHPVTPYGNSKVLAEQDLSQLADASFSPVYLRNATAFGFSPRLRFDLVLNNLTAWAHCTGRIFLKSDGTPWRPVVHIRDISQAFLRALTAPREVVHDQAFNVSVDAENYRIRQIAEIVGEIIPGCRIDFAPGAGPDKRNYRVSGEKARRLLGFRPDWTVRAAAVELYNAFRAYGLTVEEFEGPRYKRIDQIRQLMGAGMLDASLRWQSRCVSEKEKEAVHAVHS
jgi:nucleoside-diphosphate-sugar epimerase